MSASEVSDPPLLHTTVEVARTTISSVTLTQEDIERIVLHWYDLPAGTQLIWDISQDHLRSLEVSARSTDSV